jgi:hypothetical protein
MNKKTDLIVTELHKIKKQLQDPYNNLIIYNIGHIIIINSRLWI